MLALILSGCAIGHATPTEVSGIAIGHAELLASQDYGNEDGLFDHPATQTLRIRGGTISNNLAETLGALIAAAGVYFGGLGLGIW